MMTCNKKFLKLFKMHKVCQQYLIPNTSGKSILLLVPLLVYNPIELKNK